MSIVKFLSVNPWVKRNPTRPCNFMENVDEGVTECDRVGYAGGFCLEIAP
ncbi:hypothetical protein AB3R30_20165 [Leptolyngbyaceae cyanobacterium UHCC 1019]